MSDNSQCKGVAVNTMAVFWCEKIREWSSDKMPFCPLATSLHKSGCIFGIGCVSECVLSIGCVSGCVDFVLFSECSICIKKRLSVSLPVCFFSH